MTGKEEVEKTYLRSKPPVIALINELVLVPTNLHFERMIDAKLKKITLYEVLYTYGKGGSDATVVQYIVDESTSSIIMIFQSYYVFSFLNSRHVLV